MAKPVDLKSVVFTDFKSGWVVGDRGTVLRTTDGGFNWRLYARGPQNTFYAAAFPNAKTGFAVGDNGMIVKIVAP